MRRMLGAFVAVLGFVASDPAFAEWPDERAVDVYVGFAAGGTTDIMARKLLPFVEKRLGGKAKFVVQNRPGAAGEISTAAIARSAADGYALGVVNVPGYNFLPMTRKTQYSLDEIRLIARVVDDPTVVVVRADSRFNSLADVVAALKAKPSSVTVGHNGIGTNGHLALRLLAGATGVQANEVSYRGNAAQRTDLLGGHLEIGMLSLGELPELHGGAKGELKIISVLAKKRSPALPDVGTAEEQGVPITMSSGRGFAAPRGVSDDIVRKLQAAIADSLRDPDFLKSSPGDAQVLAFLPGADWQREIDELSKTLRPMAEEVKASEQK